MDLVALLVFAAFFAPLVWIVARDAEDGVES
jgi:hypothetical protein